MYLYYFLIFGLGAFAFGCCIASFLNVCIWRIPRNESVVTPPSHCPKCNARIKWYQNVPIVSWCCLRGRCANCHEPISVRYTIVEAMGGVLFLATYLQWASPALMGALPPFGMTPIHTFWLVPVLWLVSAGLILGSFIDLAEYWLPDRVTIGGMILGVPASFLIPELQGLRGGPCSLPALYWSLGGLVFGFGFIWLVGFVFSKIVKKDALGFGDVKLMGAVGAFFGPVPVLFVLIASSFIGAAIGVALIVRGKAKLGGFTAVPYGPMIALGIWLWMYWGPGLLHWYLQMFGK